MSAPGPDQPGRRAAEPAPGPAAAADRNGMFRQFEGRWGRWLPADRTTPALDLGCGSGEFVAYLRARGFTEVVGVDRSVPALEQGRRAGVPGLVCADAVEFLRDTRHAYGLISALNFFEHLDRERILAVLPLVRRALRPGGRVLAVTPNGLSPFGSATRYWDFSHETSFTPASWRYLAREAGFAPPVFEEYGPIAHSWSGVARCGLWRLLALGIEAFAWIEVGGPRDVARVYTADMKIILTA